MEEPFNPMELVDPVKVMKRDCHIKVESKIETTNKNSKEKMEKVRSILHQAPFSRERPLALRMGSKQRPRRQAR